MPCSSPNGLKIDAGVIHRLPQQLRQRQDVFESTGGLHAAALFNPEGELDSLREDVGRHNAVDKLIGHALLRFRTPLRDSVMLVSVGAPSSLAVATAERCGMTLIGFLRNGGFNVYNGSGRIGGLENPQ